MIAYEISSPLTAKRYVGITKFRLGRRVNQHKYDCEHGKKTPLYAAMRKHGFQNFVFTVIYEASSWKELCAFERGAIAERNTFYPNGFNLTIGGEGMPGRPMPAHVKAILVKSLTGKKKVMSAASRAKISAALRGRKRDSNEAYRWSDERREAMRTKMTGRKHSSETIEKMRAAQANRPKGIRKLTDEHKAAIRAAHTGAIFTQERRDRISAAQIGRKFSAESIAKMSAAHFGIKRGPQSAEHRAKIAASNRGIKKPGWTPERRRLMQARAAERRIHSMVEKLEGVICPRL